MKSRTATRRTAPRPAAKPRASSPRATARDGSLTRATASPAGGPHARAATAAAPRPADPFGADGLARPSEEETIESSKYVARAPRRFEEERFVFPQNYAVNKVRLLIRDPQWLFAHWDVNPAFFDDLRLALGERVVALSRLTLRVHDAVSGGSSVVLLPFGARSWYVRADAARRSYRAELGVTLPSGEFRLLARSNTVIMPRRAPSGERATQRVRYALHAEPPVPAASAGAAEHAALAEAGPWQAPAPHEARPALAAASDPAQDRRFQAEPPAQGGASDVHRPRAPESAAQGQRFPAEPPARGGASDVFRR